MPIELIAELVPKNSGDFPLLDDAYIRGGFHVVATLTERNAIAANRRKAGMRVAVQSTDRVYKLASDLTTWADDQQATDSLQSAYNAGATIRTSGTPVTLEAGDAGPVFLIKNLSNEAVLEVEGDLVSLKDLKAHSYQGDLFKVVANNTQLMIDTTPADFRGVQYFFTITNSDHSGFSTGQLYIVHDGTTPEVTLFTATMTGTDPKVSFQVEIQGGDLILKATASNIAGGFSRILHLFKVSLS